MNKNLNPVGWYVATYIERFEFPDEDTSDPERRCRAWKNTILIKAKSPEEAYRKAVQEATLTSDTEWTKDNGRIKGGRLVFEGLTSLLPIYDKLEDGSEIFWEDYPRSKVKTIKGMIRQKSELEAFSKEE